MTCCAGLSHDWQAMLLKAFSPGRTGRMLSSRRITPRYVEQLRSVPPSAMVCPLEVYSRDIRSAAVGLVTAQVSVSLAYTPCTHSA